MKRFYVKITQTILVEIDDDRATEKSAAYLAETVGSCGIKEGRSKNLSGLFRLIGEQDAKSGDVKQIDSVKKTR